MKYYYSFLEMVIFTTFFSKFTTVLKLDNENDNIVTKFSNIVHINADIHIHKCVIIFVNNPSLSYSAFVGADLEYPISLSYVRSSSRNSKILVTSEGFQGFSKRFLSFETSKVQASVSVTIFIIM